MSAPLSRIEQIKMHLGCVFRLARQHKLTIARIHWHASGISRALAA